MDSLFVEHSQLLRDLNEFQDKQALLHIHSPKWRDRKNGSSEIKWNKLELERRRWAAAIDQIDFRWGLFMKKLSVYRCQDLQKVDELMDQLNQRALVIDIQPSDVLIYDGRSKEGKPYTVQFRLLGGVEVWGKLLGTVAELYVLPEHLAQFYCYGITDTFALENQQTFFDENQMQDLMTRLKFIVSQPSPWKISPMQQAASGVLDFPTIYENRGICVIEQQQRPIPMEDSSHFHPAVIGSITLNLHGRHDLGKESFPSRTDLMVPFRYYYGLVWAGGAMALTFPSRLESNGGKQSVQQCGDRWFSELLFFQRTQLPPPPVRQRGEATYNFKDLILPRRRQAPSRPMTELLEFIDWKFISYAGIEEGLDERSKKHLGDQLLKRSVMQNNSTYYCTWEAYSGEAIDCSPKAPFALGTWVQNILDELKTNNISREIVNRGYCLGMVNADELVQEMKKRNFKNHLAIKISDKMDGAQAAICHWNGKDEPILSRCKFSDVGKGIGDDETRFRDINWILCTSRQGGTWLEQRPKKEFLKLVSPANDSSARQAIEKVSRVLPPSATTAATYERFITVPIPEIDPGSKCRAGQLEGGAEIAGSVREHFRALLDAELGARDDIPLDIQRCLLEAGELIKAAQSRLQNALKGLGVSIQRKDSGTDSISFTRTPNSSFSDTASDLSVDSSIEPGNYLSSNSNHELNSVDEFFRSLNCQRANEALSVSMNHNSEFIFEDSTLISTFDNDFIFLGGGMNDMGQYVSHE